MDSLRACHQNRTLQPHEQVTICHPERSAAESKDLLECDRRFEDKYRFSSVFTVRLLVELAFTRRFLHYGYAFGRNDEFMENPKENRSLPHSTSLRVRDDISDIG